MLEYTDISNYIVKCRLYPNKEQAENIDTCLLAVKVAYNQTMYEMKEHGRFRTLSKPTEKYSEPKYFPSFYEMQKACWLHELYELRNITKKCPSGALAGINGIFMKDAKRAWEATRVVRRKAGSKEEYITVGGRQPIDKYKPRYYSDAHPRRSYSYQEKFSKFVFGDNAKTFHINLCRVGKVKVRGFNRKILIGDERVSLQQYAELHPSKKFQVTVTKDICGDYFISIQIPLAAIPTKVEERHSLGIVPGKELVAVTSDGDRFKAPPIDIKKHKKKVQTFHKMLSRRQGYANQTLRKKIENEECRVSRSYLETRDRKRRYVRKIQRKRTDYYHRISAMIIRKADLLAVPSTSAKVLRVYGDSGSSLVDAGIFELIEMLRYKTGWRNIPVIDTGQEIRDSEYKDSEDIYRYMAKDILKMAVS